MATCSPVDKNSPLSNTEKDSPENVIDSTTNVSAESVNFKSDERYSYTEREGFTSEVNKVEINNIPRICGYKQLKSFFKRYKLTPLKLKIVRSRPKHSFAFATFHTPEEKQLALERMDGEILKGQKLFLKPAKPRSDPLYSKTKAPSTPGGEPDALPSAEEQAKSLLRAVTPLWDVPYSEQLVRKSADLKQSLDKIKKELERMRNHMQDIPMDEIRGSALTNGYRNKNEFTCGKDLQGRKCVGFRLGAYKKGSWTVASPDVCIHVPREVLHTVQRCNQFICTSHLDVFDPRDHSGHWKQITVRSNQEGEQLLIIQVYSQGVSREEVREECDRLCKQLESPADSDTGSAIGGKIASVYFQLCDSVNIGGPGGEMELLRGDRKLKETLLGVKFCISPNAFFQVNTPATETLYDVIRENVQASPHTVLLDLCCGTGTIGLCLAGKVGRVVGVDLCQGAIEDAVSNAELNGITNTEFLCGAVEIVIHRIPEVAREECHVVAVLDPPRAGVPAQVISTLRKSKNVKRLIYVSCNVSNASQNLVDLCRPPSSRIGGSPFSLCKVTPVDLFPHTMHCELVLCYDHVS